MSSRIYFISAGPGDPGLLTIKGKEILEKSNIVIYFKPYNDTFKEFLKNKKCFEAFTLKFEEIVKLINEANKKKEIISFLVPGDIAIFSPFSAFLNYYKDKIEIIPGVGTLNYLASKLNFILNSHSIVHKVVIISTKILKERIGKFNLKDFADKHTVLIIFMNDTPLKELFQELKNIYDNETLVHIGVKLSMKDEKIYSIPLYKNNDNIPEIDERLSLIIVTPFSKLPEKIKWWNKKVEEHRSKIY